MVTTTQLAGAEAAGAAAARAARDLVVGGSIEMGAHRPGDAARIAELLPASTPVYVNHLPRHTLADTLAGLRAAADAGLTPVPHIAARRVTSRSELTAFLREAVEKAGVTRVLALGGDIDTPVGPYADAAALLAEGLLESHGIREVAFAGYPEGHPRIPTDRLNAALVEKIELARTHGLGSSVVTQFSFAPNRIVEYCVALARRAPDVPVYVGLPGPTNPAKLLRFAQICGVSASLRALQAQGMGAIRLFTHTDPDAQLMGVAAHCASGAITNVVGTHLFTFGGIDSAARWINARISRA